MARLNTYICDCCGVESKLDELEAVQIYIFSPWNDPKLADYEQVCQSCRQDLLNLMNRWIESKPSKQLQNENDVEMEIEQRAG